MSTVVRATRDAWRCAEPGEEIVRLGDLKALLERERDDAGAEGSTQLFGRLLDDPTWPCRANLRTRMHNDVDCYVQIPNPLHGVGG